jgi:hypothetical protein
MVSLILPPGDRRVVLRSFWLIISLIFGGGICLVAWLLNLPFPWAFGITGTIASGLFAWSKETFVRRLYGAWNRRLIQPLASLTSKAVMGICLFIIFVATGRAGSRLRAGGNIITRWEARNSLPDDGYGLPFAGRGEFSAKAGWIRNYIQWAIRSSNFWSISLIPFLFFLRMIRAQDKETVEGNIYTLF